MTPRALPVLLAAALAGCAANSAGGPGVPVREVGRSAYCNTPDEMPRAQILSGAAAVGAWQSARGVELVPAASIRDRPHILVELGPRPTGGYHLALEPVASIVDGRLAVVATLHSPPAGAMVSQAITSPCVLGELAPGPYHGVEVRNTAGETWIAAPAPAGSPR